MERSGGRGRVGRANGAARGLGVDTAGGAADPAGSAADSRPVTDNQRVPTIAGLTLAHPETSLTQAEVLALLGLEADEFALGVFGRCGVERRRLHLDADLLATTLQGRTAVVEEQLMALAVEAVEALDVDMSEIGTIVSASLYSLGCPTISHRLIEHFELDPSTDKYHVVGVGCASAVPLIRLAAPVLNDGSGKKALIIAAESMSGLLCAATTEDPRSKTVGSAIFGDGCAAMLLDGDASAQGPRVLDSRVYQIPDTLEAVRIDATADDSYLALIRELPYVAGEHLRGLVDAFLTHNGLTAHMIDHWLIHPGGKRIIECAQEALSLSDDDVSVSYDVLANHGNVGTPSIFYVLNETAAQRHPRRGQQGLVVTIGPGVSVGMMLLRW
jgi:predicted naringenin-chalcone synthase